jgi:hypothetical protein
MPRIPVFESESQLPRVVGGLAIEGVDVFPDERHGVRVRYGRGALMKGDAFLYSYLRSDIPVNLRSSGVVRTSRRQCRAFKWRPSKGPIVTS